MTNEKHATEGKNVEARGALGDFLYQVATGGSAAVVGGVATVAVQQVVDKIKNNGDLK